MNKEEIFNIMSQNPVFFLATSEDNKPRVRGMLLYKADESGIIFHTGSWKEVYKQVLKNSRVELCFNDFNKNIQVRVRGELEIVHDQGLKDEIAQHPSRAFLKPWRESGKLDDFYESFVVFRLIHGDAIIWTMETNFDSNVDIRL